MKPIEGYDAINEAGELKRLPAGPQVCRIIEVVDVEDQQYHDVYFDIDRGEFKGYFGVLQANTGKNYGKMTRSYKPNALPFFKAYITAIEKSNPGYKWDWNEKGLGGKLCVINFRDEEYIKDGQVKVMAKPYEVRSIPALEAGDIKVPAMKTVEKPMVSKVTTELPDPSNTLFVNNDDLPF